tara:strand:+ start:660 stop:878 length:219 start_codon:yes stop_codon:yes gene_type:complete
MNNDDLINVFISPQYDRVFIERGSEYKEYLKIVEEIHRGTIEKELTDILNLNDWLLMQFYLYQLNEKRKKER